MWPATRSALLDGRIDQGRARVLINGLAGQPAATARAVEAAVLPEAAEQTSGQLRVAVSKALAAVGAAALDAAAQEGEGGPATRAVAGPGHRHRHDPRRRARRRRRAGGLVGL